MVLNRSVKPHVQSQAQVFSRSIFDLDPEMFLDLPSAPQSMVAQAWWGSHPESQGPILHGYPLQMFLAAPVPLQQNLVAAFGAAKWQVPSPDSAPINISKTIPEVRPSVPVESSTNRPTSPVANLSHVRQELVNDNQLSQLEQVSTKQGSSLHPRGFLVKCRNATGGCQNLVNKNAAHTRCKQCLGMFHVADECPQCLSMSKTSRWRNAKFFKE